MKLLVCSPEYPPGTPLSGISDVSHNVVKEPRTEGIECTIRSSTGPDITNSRMVREANCGIIADFDDHKARAESIADYLPKDEGGHQSNARHFASRYVDWRTIEKRYYDKFRELLP